MRKTILILGHSYATQFIDIFNQYTRLFDTKQYEVTVAYLTGKPDEEVRRRTIAENVLFLDASKKSIRGLKIAEIKKLLGLCRDKNFEIVICHRYKPSYIMMWVAQFHRIPALVFVMHELGTMSSINRQLLIAALARKNMLFAGVSNAVRDDMRKDLWCVPNERIITLYNVIDVEMTEPTLLPREEARKQLGIPDDTFLFGNIARLAINKDHNSLIKAFQANKAVCPHAKLIIMGDGELDAALKRQVQNSGLSNDIIFTGFVAGGHRYMRAFDCFVLSSIQEAFGRVLIEAMLAKLPIIATSVNGIPEVIGDLGTLVPSKDVPALTAAMRRIYALSCQDRAQLGEKAWLRANQHFSIPTFIQQFWQLPLLQTLKD